MAPRYPLLHPLHPGIQFRDVVRGVNRRTASRWSRRRSNGLWPLRRLLLPRLPGDDNGFSDSQCRIGTRFPVSSGYGHGNMKQDFRQSCTAMPRASSITSPRPLPIPKYINRPVHAICSQWSLLPVRRPVPAGQWCFLKQNSWK